MNQAYQEEMVSQEVKGCLVTEEKLALLVFKEDRVLEAKSDLVVSLDQEEK